MFNVTTGARCSVARSTQQPPEELSKDLLSLMLPDDDPFCPHLDEILSLNYDANELVIGPEYQEVSLVCPLSFYDRHIASNLVLKSVCILPFLPDTLSTICEEAIHTFLDHGHKFPIDKYCGPWGLLPLPQVHDSLSVYNYYFQKIGQALPQFPFMLFMAPKHTRWISAFVFLRNRFPQGSSTEAGFNVKRSERLPDFLKFKDENSESAYKPLASTLHSWARLYPNIGIWQFYAMSKATKKLLDKMIPTASFKWETSHTRGHSIARPSRERPLDANGGILTKAKTDEHVFTLKTRSNRNVKEDADCISPNTRSRDVGRSQVTIPRTKNLKAHKLQSAHFIQHVSLFSVV